MIDLLLAAALAFQAPADPGARLGDIASMKGVRDNALIGTGLIVGLNGTGDSATATRRALSNLLQKQNLNLAPSDLKDGNAALVMVTATLPPFAREGDEIDVQVAATGGAASLFGGTLLFTPLSGADGVVYAVAQGPVTIGGFAASGQSASVSQNHPTVGSITGGATIEEDLETTFISEDNTVDLRLHRPDFATASLAAERVNAELGEVAVPVDAATLRVRIPTQLHAEEVVGFLARLTGVRIVEVARAVIVINEKTGTIVAGEGVRISRVAIAHGNLTVTIAESPQVSQPLPDSRGVTATVPRTDVQATVESGNGVSILPGTTTIAELAAALNALGATPRDLITILQTLAQAGAVHAEIEVH